MRLYTNPASPFCRKVEVILIETDQRDDVEYVALTANPVDSPELLSEVNPIGKIPILTRDEKGPIYDSRVICRYLDDRAGAGLYPKTALWDVLTLEATGDGICDAAVLMVYEARTRPPEKRHAPWVEGQWSKVTRALGVLEDRWMDHLDGPLNAGQIAVGCALGYLDFRHADRNWRDGCDALADWYDEFSSRPAMQATVPRG